jgi:hypothetical protein
MNIVDHSIDWGDFAKLLEIGPFWSMNGVGAGWGEGWGRVYAFSIQFVGPL